MASTLTQPLPAGGGTAPRLSAEALAATLPHALWRGDAMGTYRAGGRSSGYAALDRELPGGGWPPSVLTELLWAQQGDGEFRLLAPLLSRLAAAGETIILLAPPHLVCAPALAQAGIDVRRLLLVQSEKPGDRLWAAEQILKSASCGALLCWLPQAKPDHLRRLQLAAGAGEGLSFVFRPAVARQESSPAPLRLLCRAAANGQLSIDVFKRRGPLAAAPVLVDAWLPAAVGRALARRAGRPVATPLSIKSSHALDRTLPAALAAGSGLPSLA
ncbi:MAG TPA: translesion DNA synthesis-associated protein ImuA [Burkholderiaceae bacterium]